MGSRSPVRSSSPRIVRPRCDTRLGTRELGYNTGMKRICWLLLLAACHGDSPSAPPHPTAGSDVKDVKAAKAAKIDSAGMDRSAVPGDDFYAYANGGWLRTHEIPPDHASYGTGAMIFELTQKRTAELIKTADTAPAGSEARKVGDFYASYMDEPGIAAKGITPLRPAFDAIAKITDKTSLARALGATLRADVDVLNSTALATQNLFGLWIAQDLDDPSQYSAFLLQGGLILPSRDYYLESSPRMAEIRTKYEQHVATMLRLAGVAGADAKAGRIVALEKKIAEAHASILDTEDVHKGNNHWTRAELAKRAPGLDWETFWGAAGLPKQAGFVVWQPDAIPKIAALVGSEPVATWRDYLTYHAIERVAGLLPKPFTDEGFALFGKVLNGIEVQRDRWKRGVDLTSVTLGEPVGKLYVAKYFPASEKARAEAMVHNELAAFATRIDNLAWMTPATKAKAKAKLDVLQVGVGYPDHWRDYSALEIRRDDLVGNFERADAFEYHVKLARLGSPVDRGEWVMTPQTVNAVNLPAMNALNFPAAFIQPPYFDPTQPAAIDYGSMGSVIGHEISHSFDNTGADFDATGRLVNWWTPEDLAHFKASSAILAAQYSAYKPFPDLAVDGDQTLGENIADTAGLTVAFDAYRASLHGATAPVVDGLTGDQQFFLGFAQAWRRKSREQALRNQIKTDGHAPAMYRADTVRNVDAWYSAYHVEPGQKLYLAPNVRAHIW
jgi:predicted metalloendopeptidase